MSQALVIAVVGAESTGKTTLAAELAARLGADTGLACTHVDEHLRHWCEAAGRTPRIDEQQGIAQAQQDRIAQAAASHDVVCLLYTSPSPRDRQKSRMPSSA